MNWQIIELVFQIGTIVLSAWFGAAFLRAGLRLHIRQLVYGGVAYALIVAAVLLHIVFPLGDLSAWLIILLMLFVVFFQGSTIRPPLSDQGISTWDLLLFRV